MKIAFIVPSLSNKAPILVVQDLIAQLKNKVEQIDLYYFDDIVEIDVQCSIHRISFWRKIDFQKYDIIHSHMLRSDLYVALHRKKNNTQTTFISTLHQSLDILSSQYNTIGSYFAKRIWIKAMNRQDVIVVLTNYIKNKYDKIIGSKFVVIHNGRSLQENLIPIDKIDNDKILALKRTYKIIGTHCRLSKIKGLHQLIIALSNLEDYALIIVGDGSEIAVLKQLSINLKVADRCLFLGYKSNVMSYLPLFDIYAICSYSEGFPLSLLEAALSHLPIICSNISVFKELFNEVEVCFFELDNSESLVHAAEQCYANKEDYSKAIYSAVMNKYSCEIMATNYLMLYEQQMQIKMN